MAPLSKLILLETVHEGVFGGPEGADLEDLQRDLQMQRHLLSN